MIVFSSGILVVLVSILVFSCTVVFYMATCLKLCPCTLWPAVGGGGGGGVWFVPLYPEAQIHGGINEHEIVNTLLFRDKYMLLLLAILGGRPMMVDVQ